MIQQRGVQELVAVSRDEEDLPCIYLSAIDRIFPNANVVSSYGIRIPFSTGRNGVPYVNIVQFEYSKLTFPHSLKYSLVPLNI